MSQIFSNRDFVIKAVEDAQTKGCQYWYGYLSQKERQEPIPEECVECEKVVECMLNQLNSASAVAEIKKWYRPYRHSALRKQK